MHTGGSGEGGCSRRELLTGAVIVGAGFAVPRLLSADPKDEKPAIPTRPFGKTGRTVTCFGLGSYYVGAAATDSDGIAVVQRALDLGVTYIDTAPSYVSGASERRVGKALEKRRDQVFLSTKTLERDARGVQRDLDGSLKRLRTDHVDLIQVHCVRDAKDLEAVLSEAGPLPALIQARDQGKVRFIGVTGHEDPVVMKSAIESYAWDSVLLPLNPVDPHWKSFLEGALPAASKKGIARVAMKVFASGRIVAGDAALSAEDCLRFSFALDVSTSIVGCATVAEVELAAKIASEAKPLSDEQRASLISAAARFSGKTGSGVEWYKHA